MVLLNINKGEKSKREKKCRKWDRVEWIIATKTVKINNETTISKKGSDIFLLLEKVEAEKQQSSHSKII
jgi:hypothetical protein